MALQFFTRVPVTGRLAQWVGFSPEMLRASAAHFPGVGWLVGGVGALVLVAIETGLPGIAGAAVAAVLSTAATVLLTGAFHEDGLADLADGAGGGRDAIAALEIMKDSRIGTFGAIAVVLAVGAKVGLLVLLAQSGSGAVVSALLCAHVLSRFAPLWLIRRLPHVGDSASSKSKPLAASISRAALGTAALWALPALALLLWAHGPRNGIAAFVGCALTTLWMSRLLRRRLGGVTGDGLGATQQVCELAVYLALAWRA